MSAWWKRRKRRLSFSKTFLNRVAPPGRAGKSSTTQVPFGQEVGMFHRPFHFVRDDQELNTQLFPSSSRRVRIAAALAV